MSEDPLDPYRVAALEHGGGFKATLWGSPRTQRLRFDVFGELLGSTLEEAKHLLDLGCGDGALTRWLRARGLQAEVTGLDGLPEMIDAARASGDAHARYECCDLCSDIWPLDGTFDVVAISGTLNTMQPSAAMALLEQAWSYTGEALAFNFLGDRPEARWADAPLGPARRASVEAMTAFARKHTDHAHVRSDYLQGHDVTICMQR
ncbi:MAG: class I SAM-dependent methyltransferase [Phycisphaerales bacterium]|nr:class I SAM-dependent methyltransferase [Phycisphaerales bacterium]